MTEDDLARRCRDAMYDKDDAVRALGIDVTVSGPGRAEATMTVGADMVNGHDVCHGGFLFTLADTAFAYACNSFNRVTFAAGAAIDFVRPARRGDRLAASAVVRHQGGRTGVYDVTVQNEAGEDVALFRGRSHSTRDSLVDVTDTK